jgi:hypothetical protein
MSKLKVRLEIPPRCHYCILFFLYFLVDFMTVPALIEYFKLKVTWHFLL